MSLPLHDRLVQLYFKHFSKRRKRYFEHDNDSDQKIPRTPAKKKCPQGKAESSGGVEESHSACSNGMGTSDQSSLDGASSDLEIELSEGGGEKHSDCFDRVETTCEDCHSDSTQSSQRYVSQNTERNKRLFRREAELSGGEAEMHSDFADGSQTSDQSSSDGKSSDFESESADDEEETYSDCTDREGTSDQGGESDDDVNQDAAGNNDQEDNNLNAGRNDRDPENNLGEEDGLRDNRHRRKPSLKDLINGPYADPINTNVNISRSDLLYMALGSAKQNNFSMKAFNDSIQLLNTVFVEPILPTSRFRLDNILIDAAGVKYFFYCSVCLKSFGELDYSTIKTKLCENCSNVNQISDLRSASYFCMFDLVREIEILLNRPGIIDVLLKPTDAVRNGVNGHISDLYDGSVYKDFAAFTAQYAEAVISFHFCTDGASLFKSSKNSIWPVMFCINELPPKLRMNNILLGGLWFGKRQPPMNLLLKPISDKAIRLANGFRVDVKNEPVDMRAFIIGCCVDSGARGKVQGIKLHGGYCSCNWCIIRGEYIENLGVRYPMTEVVPRRRTHQEMVRLMRIYGGDVDQDEEGDQVEEEHEMFGVQDVSPLVNFPKFDLVSGFFVEGMHLLGLGITKAHLHKWLEEQGDFNISESCNVIDARLHSLKPPLEFRRFPRKLEERPRYKAREFDNWLSYYIIPVLDGILPQKYLKLWMLLAQAVFLLSLPSVSHSHVNSANALLKHFIFSSQEYYGRSFMVFNMHILNHLAEHVARWGPLWAASAYCFENFNGYLLKIIRSQQGVPHQVIRALSWKLSLHILEPLVSEKARQYVRSLPKQRKEGFEVDNCILQGESSIFIATQEEQWLCDRFGCDIASCEVYPKMLKNGCVFSESSSKKTNNSVAKLEDNSFVKIQKIIYDRENEKVYVFAHSLHTHALFYPPQGVQLALDDHFMLKVSHVEEELRCIPPSELKTVCFFAEFEYVSFVAPIPNVLNIF